MSGIFGFAYLDGRPAGDEDFQKMAHTMAGWGPDGVGRKLSGPAAFGHALLIVTHESPYEKMPYHDSDTDVLFTAAARLDNRDELCDLFGIAHPERPTTPDGRLVWLAYKKWGSDSCKRIFGDWSFAAWHARDKRLFLARDHLGNTGLYYYFKPPLIVFASNVKAVLAHPEVPRKLNEMHLAQRLVFDYSEESWFQTYWINVCCIPGAHTVTLTQTNKQVNNYWQLDKAPSIRYRSDNEYVEGFMEEYRRAVRVRLNSVRPIGTQLSAGLDSGSVTALAAEAMREKNQTLTAFTSVPLYSAEKLFPKNITNEWLLAHQVAACCSNIEHIAIPAMDITLLAAIKCSLGIHGMPKHAASNMFWIISLLEDAKQRSIGVMLTGQHGNVSVSWKGGAHYIFYLFVEKQWHAGWRAMKDLKDNEKISWGLTIKKHLLRPALLPSWSKCRHFLHTIEKKRFFYSFPNKNFIKRMVLNYNHLENMQMDRIDPFRERVMANLFSSRIAGHTWYEAGSCFQMEVRDPTADVRLLEFCMGIPNEQYKCNGRERMLIRRAMDGILPDTVRWNPIRGRQAADAVLRIFRQREEISQALTILKSSQTVTKYVDMDSMMHAWDVLQSDNIDSALVFNAAFLRAINTGLFLLSFSGKSS